MGRYLRTTLKGISTRRGVRRDGKMKRQQPPGDLFPSSLAGRRFSPTPRPTAKCCSDVVLVFVDVLFDVLHRMGNKFPAEFFE